MESVLKEKGLCCSSTIPCIPKAVLPPKIEPGESWSFPLCSGITWHEQQQEVSTESWRDDQLRKLQQGQSTGKQQHSQLPPRGSSLWKRGWSCPAMAGCIQTKETLQGWLLHGDTSGACAQISLNKLLLWLKWLFLVVVLYKYIKAGFPGVCLQSFYTELLRQYNAHFSLPAALNCQQLTYHELPAALYIQHSQQSNKMTFVFMLCLWHLTE